MSSEDGLSSEDIEDLFKQSRLAYQKLSGDTWQMSFDGETNEFLIHTKKGKRGLVFKIDNYVVSPKDEESRLSLFTYLLELNREMNNTKFALEKNGQVSLSMALMLNKKDSFSLEKAVEAFCAHADNRYLDILNIAQEKHLD